MSPDAAPNAVVITVSDRSAAGQREDRSGAAAQQLLEADGWQVTRGIVPDDAEAIRTAITDACSDRPELILTTGGTGVGPRDITPETTSALLDRELPGIAEAVRAAGLPKVPTAMLSRGTAGMIGTTLVVNLAGSTGAVNDGVPVVLSVARHAADQARGGDHA